MSKSITERCKCWFQIWVRPSFFKHLIKVIIIYIYLDTFRFFCIGFYKDIHEKIHRKTLCLSTSLETVLKIWIDACEKLWSHKIKKINDIYGHYISFWYHCKLLCFNTRIGEIEMWIKEEGHGLYSLFFKYWK